MPSLKSHNLPRFSPASDQDGGSSRLTGLANSDQGHDLLRAHICDCRHGSLPSERYKPSYSVRELLLQVEGANSETQWYWPPDVGAMLACKSAAIVSSSRVRRGCGVRRVLPSQP